MRFAFRLFFLSTLFLLASHAHASSLQTKTVSAWEHYIRLTEERINSELNQKGKYLASDFLGSADSRQIRNLLRSGQIHIQRMKTSDGNGGSMEVDDGMIHHWLGGIFVPNVKLDELLRWLQNYDQHHLYFREVEASRLLSKNGPEFRIFFRLHRKKIIDVRYNTEHTAIYRQRDPAHASSRSFTTRIAQLDDPGTPGEREKPVGDDSGFLWRLNSYWRFQQVDGGVFVECESVSLSRGIPFGFGWIIKGYVESIPRESLQNTLVSIREGMKKNLSAQDSPLGQATSPRQVSH